MDRRELHIQDILNQTPFMSNRKSRTKALVHRTPGQILSLTAHISFNEGN